MSNKKTTGQAAKFQNGSSKKSRPSNYQDPAVVLARLNARNSFYAVTINMGWQLALTVLVPVIVGVKLDEHYNASPSYTLAALFLAVGGVCYVVMNTFKQVSQTSGRRSKKA